MGTLARNELTETKKLFTILISSNWCNQEIDILTTTNLMITQKTPVEYLQKGSDNFLNYEKYEGNCWRK